MKSKHFHIETPPSGEISKTFLFFAIFLIDFTEKSFENYSPNTAPSGPLGEAPLRQ